MNRRIVIDKCIVCGCSHKRACPNGCSWAIYFPPVCSQCVEVFAFARLWGAIMDLESKARKGSDTRDNIDGLRRCWSSLVDNAQLANNSKEEITIPTLRRVCAINRAVRKWQGATS